MTLPILLVVILIRSATPQETSSLVEAAKRGGGSAVQVVDVNTPLYATTDLVRDSVAIVKGTVGSMQTVLTHDESMVITLFEVLPAAIYKGSQHIAGAILIQRPGGTLMKEGLELTTRVSDYPESEWVRTGDSVLLFLEPDDSGSPTFQILGGSFGAFRIVDGHVTALTRSAAARRGDRRVTLKEFERELKEHLRPGPGPGTRSTGISRVPQMPRTRTRRRQSTPKPFDV